MLLLVPERKSRKFVTHLDTSKDWRLVTRYSCGTDLFSKPHTNEQYACKSRVNYQGTIEPILIWELSKDKAKYHVYTLSELERLDGD